MTLNEYMPQVSQHEKAQYFETEHTQYSAKKNSPTKLALTERIYFDHNATTSMLEEVVSAMTTLMQGQPLNPSSIHTHGKIAKGYLETARNAVKELVCADSEFNVVFTSSGTEANNLALHGIVGVNLVTSVIEHPSVLNLGHTWTVSVDNDGVVLLDSLEQYLRAKNGTIHLVSIALVNNEIGTIQPLKAIASLVHQYGGVVHTDAIQAPGRIAINIEDLGVDMMTISAHKFGGPPGAAALIYRKQINLKPIMIGGGQEYRLRPGTQNVPAIHGMGIACKLAAKQVHNMHRVEKLRNHIESQIHKHCPDAIFFGQKAARVPNTSSIGMPGVVAETQVIHFDLRGISVSAGSACSSGTVSLPYVQMSMGYARNTAETALRISLSTHNTQDEVDYLICCWNDLHKHSVTARYS